MSHQYPFLCHSCPFGANSGQELMAHLSMIHAGFTFPQSSPLYTASSNPPFNPSQAFIGHKPQPYHHQTSLALKTPEKSIKQEEESSAGKYECQLCGNKFRHKGNLQRHVNTIHKKAEEYACSTCDYKTIHKHFLNNHVKRVHQQIKRFHCKLCDYKSYDSANLDRHRQMVHFQVKSRFKCQLCDYQTFLAANLNRHVKTVHLKIKSYNCEYCKEFSCSTAQTLRMHMNNKHNIDPVTHDCRHCGKKFKALHNLKRHTKSIHKLDN